MNEPIADTRGYWMDILYCPEASQTKPLPGGGHTADISR